MKNAGVKLEWIPREDNKKADKLSKRALGYETLEVESSSHPGTFYTVEKGRDYIRCSCPGFVFKGTCKHTEVIENL